ncbi:alpha-amylase family protein [Blastococcus montanus]|uniref:alpha-amylase family protein n=1 Tax=Blastococcus montanus TaxID=3144973 RepID=UPI00320B68D5
MFDPAVSDQWWKNAVVYSVDVETFMDSDGDGVGDFRGLTHRLPYLSGLGVTCLWLLPFYPSPGRDDGYDVSDYYTVDPRLGTLGEFVEFVRTARDLGIRVVIDLVVNHTSSEHPWFQSARRDRDSPYRNWYVWADERPEDEAKVIFPDKEESNWAWDEEAGQYYLHRFYSSEPDLNTAHPDVRDEIHRVMGFWLELGVSGFRVDAAPYLIGATGVEHQMPQDPHLILQDMRGFLSRRRGDAVLFGEVNLDPGDRESFFGDGGEMTGLFNFILSGAVFAALARGEATPLAEHLRRTPSPPRTSQWLNFLRNHDELNLSRLPADEKDDVMTAFAPDQEMRIYGRGIRRRLPPMVDGDRRRIELAFSLLLTLPGTPVLLYGEEIGMGDDLAIEGRKSVRTVMQWADGPNGGFSNRRDGELVAPVVDDGPFRYQEVNVAEQRRREDSLLNRVERAIRVRKESPEFGWGAWTVLDSGDPRVLVHRCDWLDGTVLAAHNLSGDDVETRIELTDGGRLEEVGDIFGNDRYEPFDPDDPRVALGPFGYRWLRGRRPGSGMAL